MKPLLLLIAAAPMFANVTDFSSPSTSGPQARIFVTPLRNGDVDIEIEGSQAAPALVAKTARDATGDTTYSEGSIELAPLVAALRTAGAREVNIKLWASSTPLRSLPRGWRKEVVESTGFFGSK